MNYRMLSGGVSHGLAAGAIVMFWIVALQQLLPNAWFGAYPVILGTLPFAAALAARNALLLHRMPAVIARIMGGFTVPALALLLPAVFWLAYSVSGGIPMLDGTSSPLQFFWLLLVGTVFVGFTIDAAAADAGHGDTGLRWNGGLLLGFGLGIGAIALAQDALSLPFLYLLQALLSAAVLLTGTEAETDVTEPKKKEKPKFLPVPDEALRLLLPALVAFTLPLILHTVSEIPLAPQGGAAGATAVLALAAGAGLLLARIMQRRVDSSSVLAHYPVVAGVVAAVGFAIVLGGYWNGLFFETYRAWYEGSGAGSTLALHLLLLAVSMLALALAASVRDGKPTGPYHVYTLAATIGGGLLAGMLLRDTLSIDHAALFLGVPAVLIAAYEFVRWYQTSILSAVLLAAVILAGYAVFPKHQPEFRNYFDPPNFHITGEERTPSGRLTLLRSRDYDDRFYTLFWNQERALTQSSRAVQNDLYRMGHLPMLMRPPGARVLMLGLGSSLPIEAVKMHEPSSVDCVEPMAASLRLARTTAKTTRPWRHLRGVRFHNERIPAFLARISERFDVIVSAEPFAVADVDPAMFTESYFRDAADLLADGGVFMQWLPVARMDFESMRRVFAAVLASFPHTELWLSSADPESAMIGVLASNAPLSAEQPSAPGLMRLMENPLLRFHLQQIQLDRFALVAACYGTDAAGLRALAGDAAPFTLLDSPSPLRERELQQSVGDVDRLLSARSAPSRFIDRQPDSTRTIAREILASRPAILRARVAALSGDDSSTVRLLSEPLNREPLNGEVRRVLGDVLLRQAAGYVGAGEHASAVALLNGALQLLPLNTYMLRLFMIASFNIGDREASGLAIDGIRRIDPSHAGFRDNQATIRAQQGATDDALLLYENAITLDPSNEEFYCNMASFHYSQGRSWEAIRVLDQATQRAYYPAKPLYLKGMFYGEQGRYAFATEAFERYLDVATPIDPNRADVETRLGQLRSMKEN